MYLVGCAIYLFYYLLLELHQHYFTVETYMCIDDINSTYVMMDMDMDTESEASSSFVNQIVVPQYVYI